MHKTHQSCFDLFSKRTKPRQSTFGKARHLLRSIIVWKEQAQAGECRRGETEEYREGKSTNLFILFKIWR